MDVLGIHAGRARTIEPPGDGAAYSVPQSPQNWATGPEIVALVLAHAEAQGITVRKPNGAIDGRVANLANHCADVYHVFQRRAAAAPASRGVVAISFGQLAIDLYPGCNGDRAEQLRKRSSIRRWVRRLEDVGLLLRVMTRQNDRGQDACALYSLRQVPAAAVEACERFGTRRRAETKREREERRVRAFCRRSGRTGVSRYLNAGKGVSGAVGAIRALVVDPSAAPPTAPEGGVAGGARGTSDRSLTNKSFGPPWAAPPTTPPSGAVGGAAEGSTTSAQISDAVRGDACGGGRDANERAAARRALRAALGLPGELLTEDEGPPGLEGMGDSAAAGTALRAVLRARHGLRTYPAYGEISALLKALWYDMLDASAKRRAQIERAARRYDRYALRLISAGHPAPVGRDGAPAPTAMAYLIGFHAAFDTNPGRAPSPESVGWFAGMLERASKEVRDQWRAVDPDHDAAKRRRRDRRIRKMRDAAAAAGGRLAFRAGWREPDWAMLAETAAAMAQRQDVDAAVRWWRELVRKASEEAEAFGVTCAGPQLPPDWMVVPEERGKVPLTSTLLRSPHPWEAYTGYGLRYRYRRNYFDRD